MSKDAVGPIMAVTGGGVAIDPFTLTPSVIIQLVGAVVGVIGVFLAIAKLFDSRLDRKERRLDRLERKRANDIAEAQLKLTREKRNAKTSNRETPVPHPHSQDFNT